MNKSVPKLMSDKIGITDLQVIDKNGRKGRWILKLFDTETGEIFEDSSYTVIPFKRVDPPPRYAKCEEDALDFRGVVDRKFMNPTYKTFGDLQTIKQHHGEKILKEVLNLTKGVCVHNIAFIKRADLCKIFSCNNTNLNRKLNSLVKRNLIKYETKGLSSPKTIKILLHPFVFWYGSSNAKITEWLDHWCYKSDSIKRYEAETAQQDNDDYDSEVDSLEYDISYDIGVFDDSREYIGDRGYLMSESSENYLSEDKLIYLLYNV